MGCLLMGVTYRENVTENVIAGVAEWIQNPGNTGSIPASCSFFDVERPDRWKIGEMGGLRRQIFLVAHRPQGCL